MSETTGSVTWLTQDAYDRLRAEYEQLSGPGRSELAKRIEQAREEGDLKENAGYHAAKEEQGKQELRIRQLRQLLETAKVGEAAPSASGEVTLGSVVTVDLAGDEERFLLGSREVGDAGGLDVYSERSPLGAAVLGRKPGDAVSYTAPNGRQVPVKVLKVEPFTG
ncbi:transcription elongation factor GreA [Kineococcus indalonis]|uniref:transcription elongation factor GreA n=1 Tax=Kineococcus indalonis TaxID=2696566 RepID=UPI001412E572|nr:transcription elongation factor GreA [Kineococcus indalonis]NAZ87223.1 transcription elongation factor GreA [Kineococcus indalonis]